MNGRPALARWIGRRMGAVLAGGAALALAASAAGAQGSGELRGRVLDARSGNALPGARVEVVGTDRNAVSGMEGRYLVRQVGPGKHSVRVTALGYADRTVVGVEILAGGPGLDIALQPAAVAIEGLTVVSASAERGSVSRALDEQRKAINVSSSISREEIQRGPDDDAAQAVQRVSGVTVEGGKYIFVRGLGERYTTTQLNGARLPSPEPDRRVVPLDLFPAGTLEGITVSKTFTPDQAGDFSGASVNLRTRSFGSPFRNFSLSLGLNDAVTFQDVLLAPAYGAERLGFASSARNLPAVLADGARNLNDAQQAAALSQFRNAWTADQATAAPNLSFAGSTGSRLDFGGREITVLGSLSYQSRVEAQRDGTRATPTLRGTETVPLAEYGATTGRRSVLWGGVMNFATLVGDRTKLHFNNTYDRTTDNEALSLRGFDEELGTDLDITRLQFVERTVQSNQLVGSHAWDRHLLDWSTTFSRVTRREPDRSELVYTRERDLATGQSAWAYFGSGSAPTSRAFSDLGEYSVAAQADYTLSLGESAATRIKLGTLYRFTDRDAQTQSFDFDNVGLSLQERTLPAEQLFDGQFFQPGQLGMRLRANIFGGTYTAREHLGAGYAMLEHPLTGWLDLVGGGRVEAARIDVTALDVIGGRVPAGLDDVDLLPALALNARPGGEHAIRLSAARTLSRPEYRELANITYRDHVGSFLVFGNPDLRRALIDNFDARWEMYPSGGEVMSVAVFAKRFRDPIERVVIPATGAPVLSFRNADGARNHGVELELRRRLGFVADPLDAFSFGANATLVRSEVDFGGTDAAQAATSATRPLLGQAPYVVNLSLLYEAPNEASATVLYNSVGERLTEVGLGGIPDAYERPRASLDLAAEYPLPGTGMLRLEAGNLLDSWTEIRQGAVTRLRYRNGRTLSVGLAFQP